MKLGPCRLAAIGAGILLCGPAGAQSVMQPGGWQFKTTITVHDARSGESKTANESVSRMCLSKEFLSRDPYLTPRIDKEKMEQRSARCTISDEKRSANAASWKMACIMADGSSVEMTIRNTASARSFTSNIEQLIAKGGSSGIVRIVMDSSFIGECTKEMLVL